MTRVVRDEEEGGEGGKCHIANREMLTYWPIVMFRFAALLGLALILR